MKKIGQLPKEGNSERSEDQNNREGHSSADEDDPDDVDGGGDDAAGDDKNDADLPWPEFENIDPILDFSPVASAPAETDEKPELPIKEPLPSPSPSPCPLPSPSSMPMSCNPFPDKNAWQPITPLISAYPPVDRFPVPSSYLVSLL
jgi:hypothetical protein